ncbi:MULTISPECIES: hypothetical protein [Jeotgalibacillus]|uniref:hypothetical protein n=1 Tax=Jeotgalibacillus TaxID=157226 RepID=UPI00106B0453|nr:MULTISPECIES: hypothetical protein [Jeotgalibacillus]TFD99392.1 hypothetical protein E2491_08010 [Jeotgalibacillus sp. R-1-5s-1]
MIQEHQQAVKKAPKYKKLFELIEVSPNAYEKNGVLYFEAIYTNKKGKKTGSAIIPVNGSANEEDAFEAHKHLSVYNAEIATIYGIGGTYLVDDSLKTEPISLLKKETHPDIVKGREEIEKFYEFERLFVREFQEASTFYKDPKIIKLDDFHYLCEKASRMDVYSFNILKILLDEQKIFANWRTAMKEEGLWEKLSKDQHLYYNGLIDETFRVKQTLKSHTLIAGETVEEQFKNRLQDTLAHNKKMELVYREQLRWPKVK